MTATYKAVEVTFRGKLNLVTLPMPESRPGRVKVRVEAAGICHSDVATVEALFPGIKDQSSVTRDCSRMALFSRTLL